jgi:FkbM family methyltransferase
MDNAVLQTVPPLRAHAKKMARRLLPRAARNWLRSPSASARWLWDDLKFACGIKHVVEMRPGWSLICHPAAYRGAYCAQKNDPEQTAEFDGFVRNSCQGMILFDIGAHFGLFSLAALHYGGPTARAIAVDPSPTAVSFVNVQAKLNHLSDRLHMIQASASDRAGFQDMVAVGVLASGYYVAPAKSDAANEITQTRAVTLDGLVDELEITPTHIKIDVEGFEAAVLRGGQKVLSTDPAPTLFVELHNEIVRSAGGNPAESLTLLRNYGYETFTSDELPISEDRILDTPLIRVIARKPRF